jgi:hypothetical protein
MLKTAFLLVFLNALGVVPVFALPSAERTTVSVDSKNVASKKSGSPPANSPAVREDLWVCPVFESGLYSVSNLAIGGGAALGYGDRVAFGLKVVYWDDMDEVRSLELNFLARFYFFNTSKALSTKALGGGAPAPSGPFIQFNVGPVIFAWDEQNIAMPSETVMTSAGFSLGWRFLFGRLFFIEPAIRGGTPYLFGAALSAGVRF